MMSPDEFRGSISEDFPLRQWTDSFPWGELVEVIDRRVGIGAHLSNRVLLALALLRQELQCSAKEICELFHTDQDVRYACGLNHTEGEDNPLNQACPDQLSMFERYLDDSVLRELTKVQAVVLGCKD